MLNRFEYIKPNTLDELVFELSRLGQEAKILAGGSDLLVQIKKKRISPRYLIDIMGIPELDRIEEKNGEIRVGSAVGLSSLEGSSLIKEKLGAFWKAVREIGSPQIRYMGTLGGNLCVETRCSEMDSSHPWGREVSSKCFKRGGATCHVVKGGDRCHAVMAGDLATVLMALDSRVVLGGPSEKVISLGDFYTGEGKGVRRVNTDEAITQIQIPLFPLYSGTAYLKHRWRESLDFPIVNAAAWVLKNTSDGTLQEARVVLGALDSAPLRLKKVEEFLKGQVPTGQIFEEVVHEGMKGIPIVSCSEIPVRYIRRMAETFAIKVIRKANETSH